MLGGLWGLPGAQGVLELVGSLRGALPALASPAGSGAAQGGGGGGGKRWNWARGRRAGGRSPGAAADFWRAGAQCEH